ncbi:hypothetical protein COO60DRAFT_151139 [Scenedesmus sp. NREL 46B-D3]|nr:hypothetical protein COO60DRAFT_151139 [Scenedesmus sp. NREL 46B-D3]
MQQVRSLDLHAAVMSCAVQAVVAAQPASWHAVSASLPVAAAFGVYSMCMHVKGGVYRCCKNLLRHPLGPARLASMRLACCDCNISLCAPATSEPCSPACGALLLQHAAMCSSNWIVLCILWLPTMP